LLEEMVIQAAGFAADEGHEFEQEFLHALAMLRLAPDGHE
jgi:hypothetical protein